jgi:hypothetical protein
MLAEPECRQILERVPVVAMSGPFHRFADFWFVHDRLVTGSRPNILAGLGALSLGGDLHPLISSKPYTSQLQPQRHK